MKKLTEEKQINLLQQPNQKRRKIVKTIVGGATALAAYNCLPVRWGTPIIEQVFLPAHAATSDACIEGSTSIEHYASLYSVGTEVWLKIEIPLNPLPLGSDYYTYTVTQDGSVVFTETYSIIYGFDTMLVGNGSLSTWELIVTYSSDNTRCYTSTGNKTLIIET